MPARWHGMHFFKEQTIKTGAAGGRHARHPGIAKRGAAEHGSLPKTVMKEESMNIAFRLPTSAICCGVGSGSGSSSFCEGPSRGVDS